MTAPVYVDRRQPGCLITLLWFLLVGWWASALWAIIAWALIVSIVGMPLGLIMLNRLPLIATLRQPADAYVARGDRVAVTHVQQPPFLLRALWFVLVGWWLSAVCLIIAWLASSILIGIPVAIWLYNRIPAITTLARY